MIDRLKRIFSWILLLPALLPLVYVSGMLYPYLSLKTLLFRAFVIVALAIFFYLFFSGEQFYWARLKDKKTWFPGALLCVAYVTSAFGIGFYHSFWSVFNRGDGLLTLTAIVLFFYFILLFVERTFLKRLLKVVAFVGTLVAGYGLLQWIQEQTGIDFPLITSLTGRIGSTLGNAAFLAAYLGMSFFATLSTARAYFGKWRTVAYVSALLQLSALFLTGTRGAIIAFFLVACVVLVFFSLKGEGKVRLYSRVGILGLLVLSGIFFGFRSQLSRVSFEPVRRLASISLGDATVSSRLFIWPRVFSETLARPLSGFGAEHVEFVFNKVYDPVGISEQWFDRSHNAFLDYFVQFGILGALLYILILFFSVLGSFRLFQKGDEAAAYVSLLVFVYAVQNFFVFDTAVTLWLLFALYAGVLVSLSEAQKSLPVTSPKLKFLSFIFPLVMLTLIVPIFVSPLRANLLLSEGYLYHVVDVERSVNAMKKGLSFNTFADLEYGYQAYSMYTERQAELLEGSSRILAYHFAEELLKKNFEKYPYDARTATYYAHVLELAPPEIPRDENKIAEVLDRSISLSPHRIQPWYLLANISLRKGDISKSANEKNEWYKKGIEVLQKFAKQEPKLAEVRFIIANLYLSHGDKVSAKKVADEGYALYTLNSEAARRAAYYYLSIEDWKNTARFFEDVVRLNSKEYDVAYDLAKASFLAGNRDRALELVEFLRRVKPGLVETDQNFLNALFK